MYSDVFPSEICNLFNEFYVNIVAGVGSDTSINTQTMQDIEEKNIYQLIAYPNMWTKNLVWNLVT